ncbi:MULTISPECIES: DNA cytosine methyltransferase [Brevibacterium]|uniref:DNA (cytosine-5-)-methyltransferase n=2 Tax=Brevibacterium TaxID=1696 RepID=A0A2H1JKD2_BREAU|nr:DNA cytosine methyltransferase [Brevibacterium aurantiacum]SMX87804.1 C-5 cytosine-specific DNA methylase [Brevibacterium aurantiacum]
MHDIPSSGDRPLRAGSLFSGYGGLDLAVEHHFDAETIWYSELNEPVACVFSHHWPEAPNLGDISTIDWSAVPPVDILCGGFPCQDVSTVGKQAGLAPGTRSGLWSYMAAAIEALQPRYVVIENVRGLLSASAVRPEKQGATNDEATPSRQPLVMQSARPLPFTTWNPTDGVWETSQLDLFGHSAPFSEIWPTSGSMHNGSAYRHLSSAHLTIASASSSSPTARILFRTPLATDASRGGETLDQVRARRGTIALSHQIIDFALHGPAGSPTRRRDSEMLFSLVESMFADGDATPTPSPDGNTSPDKKRPPQPS